MLNNIATPEWPPNMSGIGRRAAKGPAGGRKPGATGAPLRILVTGFGGFPGAPKNPTAQLMAELARCPPRFARIGITLELAVLPVAFAGAGPLVAALARELRPDAILHFGVAPRRRRICVEARALNRVSLLHPDAGGARVAGRAVVAGAPAALKSTLPCGLIAAALRRAGFAAALSNDAGAYVCNQTFFLSLNAAHAPCVGFIHMPPLARRQGASAARLGLAAAARAAAAALLACAPLLHRRRRDRPGACFKII
jgi:pyroglutamyl-peptidase